MSESVEIPLRIVLVGPPPGVWFGIQQGQGGEGRVVSPEQSTGADLAFFVQPAKGAPKFSGPAVQGPSSGRFIYVNSGTYAGDAESCWSRRAKVPLSGIGWSAVGQVFDHPESFLEARISGISKDGGPVCASVRLLDAGWSLRSGRAAS